MIISLLFFLFLFAFCHSQVIYFGNILKLIVVLVQWSDNRVWFVHSSSQIMP